MLNDRQLADVADLVKRQLTLEDELVDLEAKLKGVQGALREVQEDLLPDKLDEFGITAITVAGRALTLEDKVRSNVATQNWPLTRTWLEEHGHADLIKHTVAAEFARGEHAEAEQLKAWLGEAGFSYTDKEGVHWQTLTAFCRERLEAGDLTTDDLEMFGVYTSRRVIIKR